MRLQFLRLLLVFFILSSPTWAAGDRHVILISIDGFAAYHLENEDLVLPNIRELIQTGVRAESSETVFPSVTHPSHTTMITGVSPRIHGVINNTVRNRITGERFHIASKPRRESIKVETLFDAAKKKGLATAAFFWPETKQDTAVDYNFPEAFTPDGKPDVQAMDAEFLRELEGAGIPIRQYLKWYEDPFLKGGADGILAEAAGYVIREYQPNLLAIHFLVTDLVQHRYGPDHYLAHAALTTADHAVGILCQAARDAGIAEQTTFIIAADHGFHTVRQELNLHSFFAPLAGRVALHAGGWTLYVELLDTFDADHDGAVLEKILNEVVRIEGVSRVIRPEELHSLGLPTYEEDPHVPGHYLVLGDIDTHLTADPAESFQGRTAKTRPYHGHGYLPSHPRMYPLLVISGAGVHGGHRIGHVSNYDIAPTISHLLGLEMERFEGRVLKEALR
ncbi:MAG: alkaline phosphatase family protein [Acidobacteriota bacterium]